jgi:hypothetical protein
MAIEDNLYLYIGMYRTTYHGYEGLSDHIKAKKSISANAYKSFFLKLWRVVPIFNIEYWYPVMLWFGMHRINGKLQRKHHLMML